MTRIGSGQRLGDPLGGQEVVVTVEHLIAVIKAMPAEEAVVPALAGLDPRPLIFPSPIPQPYYLVAIFATMAA